MFCIVWLGEKGIGMGMGDNEFGEKGQKVQSVLGPDDGTSIISKVR